MSPGHLLITGTSHTGKSTLAAQIGKALDWEVMSTDRMGRHPGRPWENTPPHVLEFYEKMSADAIHTFLQNHHQNMRLNILDFIERLTNTNRHFVLEGAALRPEYLEGHEANMICLYARDSFLSDRMRRSAALAGQPPAGQVVTEAFITRSLRENTLLKEAARKQRIKMIDVENATALADFATDFIGRAKGSST